MNHAKRLIKSMPARLENLVERPGGENLLETSIPLQEGNGLSGVNKSESGRR